MVAEYSNFASVQPVKALKEMGMVLIGVLKQASRKFSMAHLQRRYFTCRGYSYGLVLGEVNEVVYNIIVFLWVDHDR